MDTSRVDGVKAPQHFKTRRSHLALLLLLLEVLAELDRVVVRFFGLFMSMSGLPDNTSFDALLFISFLW